MDGKDRWMGKTDGWERQMDTEHVWLGNADRWDRWLGRTDG